MITVLDSIVREGSLDARDERDVTLRRNQDDATPHRDPSSRGDYASRRDGYRVQGSRDRNGEFALRIRDSLQVKESDWDVDAHLRDKDRRDKSAYAGGRVVDTKDGNADTLKRKEKDADTLTRDRVSEKPTVEDCEDEDDESSSTTSSSTSTLSYMSAPSEQDFDSDEIGEDLTLIHLHTHMNQPICSSPLLLNCYMRHLSQFHCADWMSVGPLHTIYPMKKGLRSVQSEYSLSSASHSMYSATSSWLPHFTKVGGFTVWVVHNV
jgi:hypothetical protein